MIVNTILLLAFCAKYNSAALYIKDLKLTKCDNAHYPLEVENVTLTLEPTKKLTVSGSLHTEIDLVEPIQADLWIKRRIWGVWVPMPCENNLGSCTYSNLCKYGSNTTCPKPFMENNVPCRCPIPKGNYTIPPSFTIDNFQAIKSIVSGTYKGVVKLTENKTSLCCYNIYFVLSDTADDLYTLYTVNIV